MHFAIGKLEILGGVAIDEASVGSNCGQINEMWLLNTVLLREIRARTHQLWDIGQSFKNILFL